MRRLLLAVAGLALAAGCGAPPAPPAAEVAPVAAEPPAVETPVQVVIPALHVTDDLVPVGTDALENGELLPVDSVGWYQLGPKPGEPGRALLAGHIDWDGKPGAFKHLAEVKAGDLVTVTAADGVATTFTVYRTAQVAKANYADTTVPLVFSPTAGRELALVTCGGKLAGHNYLDNTVVLARAL